MDWSTAPMRLRLKRAVMRRMRLSALVVVLLATAACGRVTTSQTSQGSASALPPVVMSGNIGCVSPSRPSPAGGCITKDAATGISLRVSGAYADVTGTVVRIETANTDAFPLSIADDQLALQSGYVLQPTPGGFTGGSNSLMVDEPLPARDFAPHVEIIASAHFTLPIYHGMIPPTLPPSPPWLDQLDHITIRVPFTISPARSGGYTYHQAPVVKQGFGVQAQSLDYSPSHSAFYGTAGGVRIELLFTGLPADMELLSFIRVESQRTIDGWGTSGDRGPGLVRLSIPGMTVNTPVMTLLQSPAWPNNGQTSGEPTVGPAGTVQFEVAFQGSGVPTGQPATLSISGIQLLTGGIDGNGGNVPVLPTYQITLPLR